VGRRDPLRRAVAAGLVAALASTTGRAENPAEVLELPQVRIVGTTPLPGSGIEARRFPANVQIHTSRDLERQGAGLADFLERNAGGISLNAAQGNPHQPDLSLRGFSASPLLGTPQGVSVFLDGVRINEPFGDSVNWDLIPQSAISSVQLIPGSMPAFGLNTLGGAVAIYTKSGASEYPLRPGASATLRLGSFGRRTLTLEGGGRNGAWDGFATANASDERGWARHNASRIRQLFAKVGWQDDDTDVDLTLNAADNRLDGTQALPASFADPREPYTWPDTSVNRLAFVAVKASRALTPTWLVSGNAYLRSYRNRNLSSNVDEDFGPGHPSEAINDAASIDQLGRGAGLQLTGSAPWAGRANTLVLGVAVDAGAARFRRSAQAARFTADRGTIGLGPFAAETDSDSTTRYLGAYVSDALALDERWTVTLAGRYNRADIAIRDRSGAAPELDGRHRYTRFNPAAGLSWSPDPGLTAYAGYNEGLRAPTAIELTCADPTAPCKLPNNFLADPPLHAVVSRTVELGARGRLDARLGWSAALYRTDLHDDIQFISSEGTAINAGYFRNVGTTRRQGLELGASVRLGALAVELRYDRTDATYRTGFIENSPNNSSADATGAISVQRGDRIPSIPRQTLKVRAELEATPRWSVGASLLAAGSARARGDENNQDRRGAVPGYARLDLDTRYDATPRLQLLVRIDNVFDRRYANFGVLGTNVFTGPGRTFDPAGARAEPFYGYGAPRGLSAAVRYRFE
jgi:outer membrane receptor protein involved in Fe transport